MSVIDDEVICPECGASLAIHCDVNSEVAILREALERIEQKIDGCGTCFRKDPIGDIARDALDRAGREPAPKPEVRSCETCGKLMRCPKPDGNALCWTPAAGGEVKRLPPPGGGGTT